MQQLSMTTRMILFLLLLAMSSCDESNDLIDLTAPEIEVKKPLSEDDIQAGVALPVEATFTDDIELAIFNIEIHENFEGHSHGRIAKTFDDPGLIKWSFKQSFQLPAGLRLFEAVLEDDIQVPENAMAGPYHFIVQAIDKAGNSTGFQDGSSAEIEIHITNGSQAVVQITNIVEGELGIEVGMLFMVEGTISDPTVGAYTGLHTIDIRLGEEDEDDQGHSHGRLAEEDLIDIAISEAEIEQYVIDGKVVLDNIFAGIAFMLSAEQLADFQAEEIDHLVLNITVLDEQGNITLSETPVHIHAD